MTCALGFCKSSAGLTGTDTSTNIRPPTTSPQPPRHPLTPSRGALLKRCLEPHFNMAAFLATPAIDTYEGFNALFLQPKDGGFEIGYLSNKPPQARVLRLEGSRGMSNTTWEEPWPKVLEGQKQLNEIVRADQGKDELIRDLLDLMRCVQPGLADTAQSIGPRGESGGCAAEYTDPDC